MLSPEISRMLASKRQIAVYNKDFEMVKKIENIKNEKEISKEISKEIKEYKMKNT